MTGSWKCDIMWLLGREQAVKSEKGVRKKEMILKDLCKMPDGVDCWSFYDNVEQADYYFDKELKTTVVAVRFKGCDSSVVIPIYQVAFLCNDKGQTIEKLNPYKSLEETRK